MFNKPPSRVVSIAPQAERPKDEIADRAIGFAQKYNTPLTPAVYQTWYTYAARENATINETLDLAMNTGQDLTEQFLTELFHGHLSPRTMSDSLSSIGTDLQSTLANVGEAMDENMKEHSIFSGTLRNAKASLVQGTSKREVSEVIRELHRANQQHLAAVQKLSVQLEKSRSQVSKLKGELVEVKRASNTDYLTGLPNRRALDEALDRAIFEARQKNTALTLLMGAIDDLETVTADWGLSASDDVLKLFAQKIKEELRPGQVASRYGGARFAVVLPGLTVADGFGMAEHFRKRFKGLNWTSKATGQSIGALSVSFGGTELRSGDDRTILIDRAATNMRKAESEGLDRSIIA